MTCFSDEVPEHQSTVSAFALDKYEVTVGRFRNFVNAYVSNTASAPADGAGVNPAIPGTGWQSAWNANLPADAAAFTTVLDCNAAYQTWTSSPGANEAKALNCVSWYEAFAFCIWDSGRLPTESEWEYAAAGGSENRLYPWGSAAPDCTYANAYASSYCIATGIASVGATPKGNGKWGHADLAGNVWEMVSDVKDAYTASSVVDYANLTGTVRGFRGGSFYSGAREARAARRNDNLPDAHAFDEGLRCARGVQ